MNNIYKPFIIIFLIFLLPGLILGGISYSYHYFASLIGLITGHSSLSTVGEYGIKAGWMLSLLIAMYELYKNLWRKRNGNSEDQKDN